MPIPMNPKPAPLDPGQPLDAVEIHLVVDMALEPEHLFGHHLGGALNALLLVAAGDLTEREMLYRLRDVLCATQKLESMVTEHLRSTQNDSEPDMRRNYWKSALAGCKIETPQRDLDGD